MNENKNIDSSVNPGELEAFRELLECNLNDHLAESFPNQAAAYRRAVVLNDGSHYIRVCVGDQMLAGALGNSVLNPSAYCFIDLSNGDILKADGWKRPAKGARGNIRHGGPENWWSGALGPYGAAYISRRKAVVQPSSYGRDKQQEPEYVKRYADAQAGGMSNDDCHDFAASFKEVL